MTRPGRARGEWRPAAALSVARVAVDVALAHLDRPFDYRVPGHLEGPAVPGVRVRVRFAGRLVDGYLLERRAESGHVGRLGWVEKVVSPEPVLTPEVAALCRMVADRYAGVLADVLRLAVPPRHARVEGEEPRGPAPPPSVSVTPSAWARYPRGPALLEALADGRAAHAVWQPLPGERWAERLAEAAAVTAATGRGALLVVPDRRDVETLMAACTALVGTDAVVALTAELGPAERYRRWLAVRRGAVPVVVGTRAAMFAPLPAPGLLAVWDDGDDSHAEPRAPCPHVRDVLVLRAHAAGAAMLVGGFARSAEAQLLVESGWAREVVPGRAEVRAAAPRVTAMGESEQQLARDPEARVSRVPAVAFAAAREALAAGRPVLVQVPRGGYLPWLSCARCREPGRCRHCAGPLGLPAGRAGPDDAVALPRCRWCGRVEPAYRCAACGSRRLRAGVVGARRTAEELGRAFPGVTVRSSGGGVAVLDGVAARPELVVATTGAEPLAEGGYGAALLLDGWAMLARPDLRVAEETLRRWMAAAALVVPHTDGGRVVVVAEASEPTVQALVRWDPAGHAAAELAARAEVGFPPAVRMAAIEGGASAVAELVDAVERAAGGGREAAAATPSRALSEPSGTSAGVVDLEVLGPVELEPEPNAAVGAEPRERTLLRVPRGQGRALAGLLAGAQAGRTARKSPQPLRVRLDPMEIG